ncbi:MAG: ribosomal RNA small subunit methyltransferase A [Gemmataceae bacterium]|nr:ribosomal RNA small subunit methyltransferase A [Gemmataceae bacterium]
MTTENTPNPRQTLSYLRRLFAAHGLEAKSKLGQNFLIDINLLDLLVRAADLTKADSVLEVGTGTGSLTAKLADSAGHVVTVEIDSSMAPVAREVVGPRPNVAFLHGDCLAKKSVLNPDMMAAWDAVPGTKKLVANLPYVIATPLIVNLLVARADIERMVVMVQWEIAERLKAMPNTKDYNALSVIVQSIADVETVRKVGPSNFFPPPKVDSAIVLIKSNPEKRKLVGDVARFRDFARNLYVHRRKNLRGALAGFPTGRIEKSIVDAKLEELEIDGNVRAESLDIATHLRLSAAFG